MLWVPGLFEGTTKDKNTRQKAEKLLSFMYCDRFDWEVNILYKHCLHHLLLLITSRNLYVSVFAQGPRSLIPSFIISPYYLHQIEVIDQLWVNILGKYTPSETFVLEQWEFLAGIWLDQATGEPNHRAALMLAPSPRRAGRWLRDSLCWSLAKSHYTQL